MILDEATQMSQSSSSSSTSSSSASSSRLYSKQLEQGTKKQQQKKGKKTSLQQALATGDTATSEEIARLEKLGKELSEDVAQGHELMSGGKRGDRTSDGIETKTQKQSKDRGKARSKW